MEATNSFRTYIGTKAVKAMPMGAGHAKRHGANITEQTVINNRAVPGYLVEYEDNYRSWSPAKTFEGTYRIAETHVDLLKIELADLNERICKDERTLNTYGAVPEDDRLFLKRQLNAMREYADILYDRIRWAEEQLATLDCGCYESPIK